jgi:hypothetical protein
MHFHDDAKCIFRVKLQFLGISAHFKQRPGCCVASPSRFAQMECSFTILFCAPLKSPR